MSGHHCHALACDTRVPPRLHMCPRHWRMVPKPLQRKLWAEYRPGQERDKQPSAAYLMAAAGCIEAGHERRGRAVPLPLPRSGPVTSSSPVPVSPDLAEIRRLAEAATTPQGLADLLHYLLDRIKELETAAPKLEQVAWGRPNPWRPMHGGPHPAVARVRLVQPAVRPRAAGAAGPAGDPETGARRG